MQYEVFQKWNDPAEKRCKFCGGKVVKLVSPAAFHLKGGGWYSTDYSGKTAPDTAKQEAKNDKPCASSAEATTNSSTE